MPVNFSISVSTIIKKGYKLAAMKTLKLSLLVTSQSSLIRNYGVCQKHFKNNCFQQKLSPFRNKLNHNAVPENISNRVKFIGLGLPYR